MQIDHLLGQANIYLNELASFSGSLIPTLYGILQGTLSMEEEGPQDEQKFACLVLEDCDDPIFPRSFSILTEPEK